MLGDTNRRGVLYRSHLNESHPRNNLTLSRASRQRVLARGVPGVFYVYEESKESTMNSTKRKMIVFEWLKYRGMSVLLENPGIFEKTAEKRRKKEKKKY